MPVTEGHEQGKPWTEVRPNGHTVEYTIPKGNGKNTVDAIVRDSTGKVVSTARIVSIEGTAKYIRWQDDVGAGSSYFESGGPNELGYGQHFAPGTSTSGIPSWIFETSPDLSKTRTLSVDSGGRVVGVDIGVRNSQGLYDNIHVDNFGNATVSSTRLTPSAQLESKFTGQMFANRSGWLIDEQDNHWQGEPDKDGNQSWLRVENGHTYRMNYLGVITDFSLDKDGRPRLDTIFPDGSQTTQSGRTTIHFDANGNEAWRKEIAAPVQPWDIRAWNATKRGLSSVGSLISDTAGAPFHMAQDGVRGMSSVRVDQYGTFHVTYDAPNRFANAGTAAVGLVKGAAMFYLALPKYGIMQGYDALRGSDFVRGSTSYQPPDREDELVKDLTGIPLKQWKEDTVASAFEFGTATAAGALLFKVAGIGRRSGTRSTSVQLFEHSRAVLNSLRASTSSQIGRLVHGAVGFGRSRYDHISGRGAAWAARFSESLGEGVLATTRLIVVGPEGGHRSPSSFGMVNDGSALSLAMARNQRFLPKVPGKPVDLPNLPRKKLITVNGDSIAVRRRTLEDGTEIELRISRPRTEPKHTSGFADGLPAPQRNVDGSWTISLRSESGWVKADFDVKAQHLVQLGASGQLRKMSGQGAARGSKVQTWRNMKLKEIFYSSRSQAELDVRVTELDGQQIDHAHDLQLGGKDSLDNMWALDATTNHGMGGQINSQLLQVLNQGAIIRVRIVN
ncbi:hypothetical protein [Nocardia salmonicida]|uniref:hypothetical protein n=1 Tax=Nocardia salmonicida TaxID=53431 RepID=UPI0037A8B00A